MVNVKRAVLSVVFEGGQPRATIPNKSAFGNLVSLKHLNMPISFVDRIKGSRINSVVHSFVGRGGVSAHCISHFPSNGDPVSLTFLSGSDGTSCAFCGSCPGRHLSIPLPRVGRSSVFVCNSCCSLGPTLERQVIRFLSCTHRHGTVLCCSPGFHGTRTRRTVRLTPALLRGFRCTSVVHNSSRSFLGVFKRTSDRGICASRVHFCYSHFVAARKTKNIGLCRNSLHLRFSSPSVHPIDAVKTNSGFGTNVLCNLLGGGIHRHSLTALPGRA